MVCNLSTKPLAQKRANQYNIAMSNTHTFSKKIRELTQSDIEYTEDFFRQTFGTVSSADDDGMAALQHSAKSGHRDISHHFGINDADIDETWLTETETTDGQLAVDVFETDTEIVIMSTVAGVRKEDLDIDMNGDMITIRGTRRHRYQNISEENYFIKECFWGSFSRSIILPADIQHDRVSALLENGVLIVRLPKSTKPRNGKIPVEESVE